MAINMSADPALIGKITQKDSNYPFGSSKDETSPGANNGTPYNKKRANDIFGFQQALLYESGIVPSGSADTAINSQYLDALKTLGLVITPWTEVVYSAPWIGAGNTGLSYTKRGDTVTLQGSVSITTNTGLSNIVASLPADVRPLDDVFGCMLRDQDSLNEALSPFSYIVKSTGDIELIEAPVASLLKYHFVSISWQAGAGAL